jgi:hypothetical protein
MMEMWTAKHVQVTKFLIGMVYSDEFTIDYILIHQLTKN